MEKISPWQHIAGMDWKPQEWLDWPGRSKCPLFQAIGVTACSVQLDWLHVKYLGNDQYLYASVFHLLCFVVLPSTPVNNLLPMWEEMKSLYKTLGIVHQYRYFNRSTMFQRKSGPPKLTGKGGRDPSLAQSGSPPVVKAPQPSHYCASPDFDSAQIEFQN